MWYVVFCQSLAMTRMMMMNIKIHLMTILMRAEILSETTSRGCCNVVRSRPHPRPMTTPATSPPLSASDFCLTRPIIKPLTPIPIYLAYCICHISSFLIRNAISEHFFCVLGLKLPTGFKERISSFILL